MTKTPVSFVNFHWIQSIMTLLLVGMEVRIHADDPCVTELNCPSEIHLTTSGSGATADISVTATNPCATELTVQCYLRGASRVPISPTTLYPVGTNVIDCQVMDEMGLELTNCSFQVIVELDTQPPHLVRPARLILPCTEPGGTTVEFTAGAIDDHDATPVVTCAPASGSFFPSGTNTVTCTALDAAGNRTVERFEIIVGTGCEISRCLEWVAPEDMTVPCTSPAGAMVEFAPVARNSCTGADLPLTCTPPSGSVFPVGITKVFCAVDVEGIQGAISFLVEVTDPVPPELQCPSHFVVQAMSPLGVIVDYGVTASDDCSPNPRVRCAPASGTVFPVGDTRVTCEAADDSGNVSQCQFVVTVLPPEPLTLTHLNEERLELRWTGDAVVESSEQLGIETLWEDVEAPPIMADGYWVLVLPVSEASQYFRLRLLPVAPAADQDRDGVPDEEDQCPNTPAGLPVDEYGCALFDFIATPTLALRPFATQRQNIRQTLLRWPSMDGLSQLIPEFDDSETGLPQRLINHEFEAALGKVTSLVMELNRALSEVSRTRTERMDEIARRGPFLSDGYADMRNEDYELTDLAEVEESLAGTVWHHQELLLTLSNIVQAIDSPQPRQRFEIMSMDNELGVATLTDGTQVLLPREQTAAAPPLSSMTDAFVDTSLVDLTVTQFPDGSSYAVDAVIAGEVSEKAVTALNPRRLDLRVTPVDFGLPNFDLAPRLHLKAYRWGFTDNSSRHYLEFNQAFAAIKFLSFGGEENHKHWLTVDVDRNGDGSYAPLIYKLDESSPPYVLKKGLLPEFKPFNIRVREFRAEEVNGTVLNSTVELVGEEFHVLEINAPGHYAEAIYERTAFDLPDAPNVTGHRVARVTGIGRIFPLTLKPLHELTFSGSSFKVVNNGSSFPNTDKIGLNEPFAIHIQDPNDYLWYANPNDFPKGIYAPRVYGYNHGQYFSYRAMLPDIVRDLLHDCPGSTPDTFYKIPLSGQYSVSQGNNGEFTHKDWQRYAWDFPKPAFTPVLAARGGVVVDLRESANQSCYIPFIPNPDGTKGSCVSCTGAAANNFVKIRHQDGTFGVYAHFFNNAVNVNINQRVYRGSLLGLVGTTGCSSGNHLHFHVVNAAETTTIPVRFESILFDALFPCYLPPSQSVATSTQ